MKNKWHLSKSKKIVCGVEKKSLKGKYIPWHMVGLLAEADVMDKTCTKCLYKAPKIPKNCFRTH